MNPSSFFDIMNKKECEKMNKQIFEKKKECEQVLKEEEKKSNKLSNIRLLLFILFILSLVLFLKNIIKPISLLMIILTFLIFITIVIIHHKIDKKIKNMNSYLNLIQNYEKRTNGKWKEFKDKGTDIYEENDLTKDFNLIGTNSLYQLLNIAKSIGGRKKFIDTLVKPKKEKNIIQEKNEAITELKDNFSTVLELEHQLLEIEDIEKTNFEDYFTSLDKKITPKKKELIIGMILACISDIVLVICLLSILPFQFFILVLLIQTLVSYIYIYFHDEELEELNTCSRKLSTLKKIDEYILSQNFKSKKLKAIHNDIQNGYDSICKLSKINELNNLRSNFVTNVLFNTIMSLNIVTVYQYASLISNSHKEMKKSILALEDLESLMSLTTITFVKQTTCLPTITEETKIEFKEIRHPLLEEKVCVPNDFECDSDINIITGSNMSGKSSFMKTIGINLILMEAGTYVNANSFISKLMTIFSSIKVEDDLNNNISTFYGELLRIKKIIDYTETKKDTIIVFIDEIFKGTNYNDRIYGAKEIIKKLSKLDCIAFITTHDFELCEIENKKINNYHFEEKYEGTNISFDYKLLNGKCKTTNAKYLMEKLGFIEK